MEARHVPFNYSRRWLQCSIKIGEKHYSLFLGSATLLYVLSFGVSLIPYVGMIPYLVLSYMGGLASLRLLKQIQERGVATFDDYLKYLFDPILFEKFRLFLIGLVGLAVVEVIATYFRLGPLTVVLSVGGIILSIFCAYASFMMLQHPSLDEATAFKKVVKGIFQNFVTWLTGWILFVILICVCAVLCLVPLFLYALPMTFAFSYLIYSSIFESLDIDQAIAQWSAAPKPTLIETTPPPLN